MVMESPVEGRPGNRDETVDPERPRADARRFPVVAAGRAAGRGRTAGVAVVFFWFLIGGLAHFVFTEAEMRVVPPWMPAPRLVVLVSGAFELLGAIGLLWTPTRRAAGMGLALLTIAVTPVHVHMLARPDLFDVPYWALVLRLPLQGLLLWLILWSTAPPARH